MASCIFAIQAILMVVTKIVLCKGNCSESATVCEFYLELDHKLTMMMGNDLVFVNNGHIYKYDVINTSTASPIDPNEVITADGWEDPRLVTVFNGTMPGPPIIVYEGQTVIVRVKNSLRSEATTIHWHGLHQRGRPWMDGVPFVTQCPILPGQTFTYEFLAEPKGTFWYHSHMGGQRTMGAFGALIIRNRREENAIREYVMTLQDWNHDWDSEVAYMKVIHGMYEGRKKVQPSMSIDGALLSMFKFQSGLFNGRGRYHDPVTGKGNGAPLEVFEVEQGQAYMFRIIGVGTLYPFRMSVDGHDLTIVASDGFDLESEVVESFIINPGERFDFILYADKPVSNYWIRGLSIETNSNHSAEAILRYNGAPIEEPITSKRSCTKDNICVVVNCPHLYYPLHDYTKCKTFDKLKAATYKYPAPDIESGKFKEFFLNFGFPGTNSTPASVNGRTFEKPTVSAMTQPQEFHSSCDRAECGEEKVCSCSYVINIDDGDTVQITLLNMGNGKGYSHPVHLHGHAFHLVKMGYGQYNDTTAKIIGDNLDINCRGNPDRSMTFCNNATWANNNWLGGNVPGLELERPPRKDTIIVPTGGYVVIRLKADNPGLWNFHCHVEFHNLGGMQLLVNESFSLIPKPPSDFPTCWNFPSNYHTKTEANDNGFHESGKRYSKHSYFCTNS
ncbi:hypothetical protein CHS0354_028008 [Potamilus streckersoni]|uniref:Laccase n=1 Tax=Potamilus streckersoni TaxID=2493646 RepID=A0AAE0RMG1_9BIVA|nr:hypothetical protein CHS0354_028008 [Potamilus streckersoni]